MFYQNNNDYMRDAFFYSQPQNSTYQYPDMNNMNNYNAMGNNMMPYGCNMNYGMTGMSGMNNQPTQISSMYPQVYRIIDPVANRVIANNNYPYYTEDNLNNMVDTVYNIVQGDISSLNSNNNMADTVSDDTVTQGASRTTTTTNANNNTRQTNTAEVTRTVSTVNTQNTNNDNQLLKDLIKIIIIKQLLSRPNNNNGCRSCNMNNMPMQGNYYDTRYMGMM